MSGFAGAPRSPSHRVGNYTIAMIDQLMAIVTAATMPAVYGVYGVGRRRGEIRNPHLYLTVPFVVFGIFRSVPGPSAARRADPAWLLIRIANY